MTRTPLIISLVILAFAGPLPAAIRFSPADSAPLKFAATEIERAARDSGRPIPDVTLFITPGIAQSYRIERDGASVRVIGGDAVGAMYGDLAIAEAMRLGTLDSLPDSDHKPHIAQRGIKFNIPLDLRTPSYTDSSDAAQANIPEVTLNDVWRTKAKLDDPFSFSGSDMVRPDMLADHEVVKILTIDEKIVFWRWVMQQAADRGIRIYVFTWNVFTFGAEGKHGITNDMENANTKQYFRATGREMVRTYPLLAGMGITAGEGMPHDTESKVKEKWLWDTYGKGVTDALKDEPERDFNLIHRFHWTAQSDILDAFIDYPGTFDFRSWNQDRSATNASIVYTAW